MKIYLKLFASVRDKCGYSDKELDLQDPVTVEDILSDLYKKNPDLTNRKNLLVAVNKEYATGDTIIKDGDTVAIFPPVSGG